MAWELYLKHIGADIAEPDKITISSRKKPGGRGAPTHKDGRPMYLLTLGRKVAQELGWESVSAVVVFWGNGNQAGQIKIEPITNGTRGWPLRKSRNGTLKITTSVYPDATTGQSYERVNVQHQILENVRDKSKYLIVILPKNFFAPLEEVPS